MALTKGQEIWEELYSEREIINDERELEELLIDRGILSKDDTPEFRHSFFYPTL